jgi:hypothetical protein
VKASAAPVPADDAPSAPARRRRRGGAALILAACAASAAATTVAEPAADAALPKQILLAGVFLVEGSVVATNDPFVDRGALYERVFSFRTFNTKCHGACPILRLSTQPNGDHPGAHHLVGLARRNAVGGVYTGVIEFDAPATCKTRAGAKFTMPNGNHHVAGYTIHVAKTDHRGLNILLRVAERITGEIRDTSISSAEFNVRCGSRPFEAHTTIRFLGHRFQVYWPPDVHPS